MFVSEGTAERDITMRKSVGIVTESSICDTNAIIEMQSESTGSIINE